MYKDIMNILLKILRISNIILQFYIKIKFQILSTRIHFIDKKVPNTNKVWQNDREK